MSESSPNRYNPSVQDTQAALDKVNRAVEGAINQKVGRLAQLCVALIHKLGDFDAVITERELNAAAGWSLALDKIDQSLKLKTAPPVEELEQMMEVPPEPGDATSFLM